VGFSREEVTDFQTMLLKIGAITFTVSPKRIEPGEAHKSLIKASLKPHLSLMRIAAKAAAYWLLIEVLCTITLKPSTPHIRHASHA